MCCGDFTQTRNIRRAFLDNDFYNRKRSLYELGYFSRADVTVYLCSTITRFQSLPLQNSVLFKWVLIVISNEHCRLTSSQNASSNSLPDKDIQLEIRSIRQGYITHVKSGGRSLERRQCETGDTVLVLEEKGWYIHISQTGHVDICNVLSAVGTNSSNLRTGDLLGVQS